MRGSHFASLIGSGCRPTLEPSSCAEIRQRRRRSGHFGRRSEGRPLSRCGSARGLPRRPRGRAGDDEGPPRAPAPHLAGVGDPGARSGRRVALAVQVGALNRPICWRPSRSGSRPAGGIVTSAAPSSDPSVQSTPAAASICRRRDYGPPSRAVSPPATSRARCARRGRSTSAEATGLTRWRTDAAGEGRPAPIPQRRRQAPSPRGSSGMSRSPR